MTIDHALRRLTWLRELCGVSGNIPKEQKSPLHRHDFEVNISLDCDYRSEFELVRS